MTTNIERLHDVVEGKVAHRGCGKTYAKCHEVAGLVEVGNTHIICIISVHHDLGYILPMMFEVLDEHEIQWVYDQTARRLVLNNDSVVRFFTEKEYPIRSKGLGEHCSVLMRHQD